MPPSQRHPRLSSTFASILHLACSGGMKGSAPAAAEASHGSDAIPRQLDPYEMVTFDAGQSLFMSAGQRHSITRQGAHQGSPTGPTVIVERSSGRKGRYVRIASASSGPYG